MSTLNVANISDDQSTLSNSANPNDALNNTTTLDTKYVTNGCAKAWCNFTMSSIFINDSMNTSSITEPIDGTTEQNLFTHMSNYSYLATTSNASTYSSNSNYSSGVSYQSPSLAAYTRIRAAGTEHSSSSADSGLAIFGTLA